MCLFGNYLDDIHFTLLKILSTCRQLLAVKSKVSLKVQLLWVMFLWL